jgi:ethanolaminephosphotransferase
MLQAICFFIYRIFDEMDGKQARRTGSGSPFGMMFDHGFDCLAMVVQPIVFGRILQVGDNLLYKLFFAAMCNIYYIKMVEQYYINILYQPQVGSSDGSILILFVMAVTAYLGNDVFNLTVWD